MDTQTNDFGDYTLNQTSPSCSTGCTCNLRLVETVPAGYTAVSASEPSAYGSVVSATEIKYSWITSGSYPNNNFALSGPAVITYQQGWRYNYFAGEKRIAVRGTGHLDASQNGLFFLLGDHLNSTAITMDQNGVKLAELRYMPWGETRYTSGGTPTDRRYTGQRELAELGLYHYGARFYDPALGRFVEPDPIVPLASQGVQSFDRFAYTNNNPVKYNDPTGHMICDPDRHCGGKPGQLPPSKLIKYYRDDYDIDNKMNPRSMEGRNKLILAIDSYLRKHPYYKENLDPGLIGWDKFEYIQLRQEYWLNRANGDFEEAYNLRLYYDYHIVPQVSYWDTSSIDWINVGLDLAGLATSILGLNPIPNRVKLGNFGIRAVNFVNFTTGVYTSGASISNNDGPGTMFNILGFVPGPIGAVGSVGSLFVDLSRGYSSTYYKPSLIR